MQRQSPASGIAPLWRHLRAARRSRTCRSAATACTMPISRPTSPALVIQNALTRGARRLGLAVPVADQQVRAEADQLPADEQLQEVRREHQPHHREREQRLVARSSGRATAAARRAGSRASRPARATPPARPAAASGVESASASTPTVASGAVRDRQPRPHGRIATRLSGAGARHASDRGQPARRRRRRSRTRRPAGPSGAAAATTARSRKLTPGSSSAMSASVGAAVLGHHPFSRSRWSAIDGAAHAEEQDDDRQAERDFRHGDADREDA